MYRNPDRDALLQIYLEALRAVDPERLVDRSLTGRTLGETWLLALGKAALPMARGAIRQLGESVQRGLVIAPEEHADAAGLSDRLQVLAGSHPVPDHRSLQAGRAALSMVSQAREADASLLVLLSGGASSMAALPAPGLTLEEKAAAVSLLLRSGASIQELNCVRRHLSAIKGGRLAEASAPQPALILVMSDVLGNPLEDIGSGPFAPDPTTYEDAHRILRRFTKAACEDVTGMLRREAEASGPCLASLEAGVCGPSLAYLKAGIRGGISETLKPGDPCFGRIRHEILADTTKLRDAAASASEDMGLTVERAREPVEGKAAEAGRALAERLHALALTRPSMDKPLCHVSSGETTVTVRGSGRGGRNQELALAFALRWEELAPTGEPEILLLSAGSDGIDGPTDAAGAVVDPGTLAMARERGLDARSCLRNNDSYSVFAAAVSLVRTGPTGVNLADLQIAIIR